VCEVDTEFEAFVIDRDQAAAWIEEEFSKQGVDVPRGVIRLILDMEHRYQQHLGIAAKHRDGGVPHIISFNMN